jgi:hypothetical protein
MLVTASYKVSRNDMHNYGKETIEKRCFPMLARVLANLILDKFKPHISLSKLQNGEYEYKITIGVSPEEEHDSACGGLCSSCAWHLRANLCNNPDSFAFRFNCTVKPNDGCVYHKSKEEK